MKNSKIQEKIYEKIWEPEVSRSSIVLPMDPPGNAQLWTSPTVIPHLDIAMVSSGVAASKTCMGNQTHSPSVQ